MFDLEDPILMLLAAIGVVAMGLAATSAVQNNYRHDMTVCVSGKCVTVDRAEFEAMTVEAAEAFSKVNGL